MAKTRKKKESEVREIVKGISGAKSIVLADISPLKVGESNAFRRKAEEQEIAVRTVKKTLLRIAGKEAGLKVDDASLTGSVTMLFGSGDEVAPARLVAEVQKSNEGVVAMGGILESSWMTGEQVMALARLPSKEELLAKAVGSIRAPLSGLVGVLQGNLRNLVYVLNAVKDSKSS